MATARSPISIGARYSEEGKMDKDNHLPLTDLMDDWGDEGKFIPPSLFKTITALRQTHRLDTSFVCHDHRVLS